MPQSDNGLTFGDSESGNGLTFQKPPSVNGLDPSLASPDWDKVIGRYSNSTVPGTKGPEDLQSAVTATKSAFEAARAKRLDVAPTEERGLLGEFGTAALRGAAQVPVSLKKLSAIAQGKDSENIRLTHALDPSRDDVTGKVANFAGGFVPILASGGASKYVPAAIFGLEGFTRTYERTQGNIPASVAVGVIDAGLGLVPIHALYGKLPGIEQAVEKLGVAGVQKVLTKRSLEMLSSGTAGALQNLADESLARAGGATPQDFNPLEAGLGMAVAHGALSGPKVLGELKSGLQTKQVYQSFVKEKLLSPLEAEQLKADPKLAAQVVRERLGNKNVSLVTGPDGKLVVDSKPDTVPWSLKRAAGHNEVKIQFMRDEIAAGRTTIFEDTSRLPPLPEEIAESSTKLTKLHEQLTTEVPPTEFTALGGPVTERALYVRDLKLALDRLATEPTRENYEIAQGLMREKSSLGKSTEIITADRSAGAVDSKEILSEYDPTPPSTIRLPLLESEAKGYFKPPEEITNDPKLVARVAAAQRKSMLDSSALTNTSKLTAAEKVEMFGVLDAEHQARIEGILEKDTTTSTTKAKVKSRVSRVKSDPKKIEALTAIDRSFETVAKHSENPSERELNDLLKLELKDAPPEIRELLDQVNSGASMSLSELTSKLAHAEYLKRVAKGEPGDEAGDWAKAEQRLRRSLVDVTLAKTRDQIVMGLKGLSAEQGRPFIDELASAKSPEEIQVTADKITKAQQVEQRKTEYELIKRLTSRLDQKLARDPVLDTFTKRVQPPKLAEAPETVGVRAMKVGGKVYEAKPGTDKTLEETHANVITRIEAEHPELKKQMIDLRLGDQDSPEFGFVTSRGRYVTRAEAEALKSGQGSTIESSQHRTRVTTEFDVVFGKGTSKRIIPVIDAFARGWARAQGKTVDQYYEGLRVVKGGKPGQGALYSIIGWHGSPHKFPGNFDISKVGTGEGGPQQYPWGLFYSSKQEVSEWYQEVLSASRERGSTHTYKGTNPADLTDPIQAGVIDHLKQFDYDNDAPAGTHIRRVQDYYEQEVAVARIHLKSVKDTLEFNQKVHDNAPANQDILGNDDAKRRLENIEARKRDVKAAENQLELELKRLKFANELKAEDFTDESPGWKLNGKGFGSSLTESLIAQVLRVETRKGLTSAQILENTVQAFRSIIHTNKRILARLVQEQERHPKSQFPELSTRIETDLREMEEHLIGNELALKVLETQKFELKKAGSLHKVELQTELDKLVDWRVPLKDQSKTIQTAFSRYLEMLAANPRMPDQYAAHIRGLYQLENTPEEIVQVIRELKKRPSANLLHTEPEFSRFLREQGVPGATYIGRSSGVRNYIMFHHDEVKSLEVYQRQQSGTPAGSYELKSMSERVIRALTSPNVSTPLHEIGHDFLEMLPQLDGALAERAAKALGAKDHASLTTPQKEQFTRAFEAYGRDGKAPSSALKEVFESFKQFLIDLYQSIVGTPLEGKLTPEIRKIFDEMLTRGDSKESKSPKPIVETDPSTGKRSTNWKVATSELDKLSNDQVTLLANELKELTRAAAIERGLYNRWLGFSTSRDNQTLTAAIVKSAKPRGALAQRYEKWTHGLSNWINPITTESWLAQMSGFDENNPIRKILHGDIVDGQTRSYQNQANARRSLAEHSKATLGFDTNTTRGMEKLWAYLLKPIHGDFTRGEAINAYLISRDPGRQDINEIGIIKNGVRAQVSELVPKLTPKDLEFGERLRRYFDQNPVVEKTISNFTLLNGHEPPRNPDHWVSGRAPSEVAPKPGEKPSALDLYATYKVGIERMINPLRERMDGVNTPYEARDVVGEYLRASDQISDFAEMGLPLFRATQTLYSPEVVEAINKHWGRGGYEKVQLYLADIMGTVGTQRTLTDDLGNTLINSYATSKIALNVGSAAKQTLDVLTFLAEGTLSKKAVAQAMAEGAWLNKGVTQRMMDNAGVAYLRYHGHFLDQISMASQTNQAPSKLQSWQYRGLILQRAIDKRTLSIAWRSAEIEAASKGLKGNAALEDATKTFNLVVGRAQPTSNPLYSGELETQAKRNMLLRGSLLFMRAPNRIYNVVRRRVVEAVQNPTQENVNRAGQAVLFGLIGNTLGIVAINSLRRAVFNKPQDEKNLAGDTVDSLTGMFYLGAPANAIAAFLVDQNTPSNRLERSPFLGMSKDLYDMTTHGISALNADGDLVKSGPHRGESKSSKEGLQALESAFSLSGGVSGLPLWGLWNQGKGLYSWTEPQYRLMTEFEKEIRQLKADGREGSLRYRELDEARDDINKYHQLRTKGLATEGSTQSAIERRLRQVVR